MRKVLFLLVLAALSFGLSAQAQNNAEVVKSVRAAYAAAKEQIKLRQGEDGAPRNDAVVTMHYNVPATGGRTTVAHCYFDLDTDENGAHYYPFFITLKYNVAAREYYEEYLYHPESGRLLFAFIQLPLTICNFCVILFFSVINFLLGCSKFSVCLIFPLV